MVDKKRLDERFYYDFTIDELKALEELVTVLPKSSGKEVIIDVLNKAANEPEIPWTDDGRDRRG